MISTDLARGHQRLAPGRSDESDGATKEKWEMARTRNWIGVTGPEAEVDRFKSAATGIFHGLTPDQREWTIDEDVPGRYSFWAVMVSSELEPVCENIARGFPALVIKISGHHYGYAPPETYEVTIRDGKWKYDLRQSDEAALRAQVDDALVDSKGG
jgi:hypothetical protein